MGDPHEWSVECSSSNFDYNGFDGGSIWHHVVKCIRKHSLTLYMLSNLEDIGR